MRKQILVLILLAIACCTYAQVTFNHRLNFGMNSSSVLVGIGVTDSCYYAMGTAIDTTPPYDIGSLFVKFDLNGDVVFSKLFTQANKNYQMLFNTLSPTLDGNWMATGLHVDSTKVYHAMLKYNSEGDTLFTKKFISPYYPEENFLAATSSCELTDGGFILSSNVLDPNPFSSNLYLVKTDSLGHKVWDTIYIDPALTVLGNSTIPLAEGKMLVGATLTNNNLVGINYISRMVILKLDSNGEIEWEYKSPEGELLNGAQDILLTDDGGYLIASGKGVEYSFGNPNIWHLLWHNYIYKLDENRNFEWGVEIIDTVPSGFTQLNKLVKATDDSGYLATGSIFEYTGNNAYNINGQLSKVSKEGDSLWTRYYHHVDSPADYHVFDDLEATSDGGYIMVGEAIDLSNDAEAPHQRSWILKVDEYGCLVPGCELVPTFEPEETPFEIKLYPNPANEYLNVYFYHSKLETEAKFSLTNSDGRIVKEFTSNLNKTTHMIPVWNLPAGIYSLTCQNGKSIVSKQLSILR